MSFHRYLLPALSAILLCVPSTHLSGAGTSVPRNLDAITLRGTVTSLDGIVRDETGTSFDIHLDLTLINTRTKPLMFLTAERPIIVGGLIAEEPEITRLADSLDYTTYGPSIAPTPEYALMRSSLDVARPPSDMVRILMPNEQWQFQGVLKFRLRDSLLPYCRIAGVCMPASSEPVRNMKSAWLRAYLEIWPTNLEPFPRHGSKTFGHMLQKRWRKFGVLQLERVVSEPIKFNLTDVPAPTILVPGTKFLLTHHVLL